MNARHLLLTVGVLALCAAPASARPQPPARWTDGYVTAKGIRLRYLRTGGNKPALVMAHGSSDDGLCSTNLARSSRPVRHRHVECQGARPVQSAVAVGPTRR